MCVCAAHGEAEWAEGGVEGRGARKATFAHADPKLHTQVGRQISDAHPAGIRRSKHLAHTAALLLILFVRAVLIPLWGAAVRNLRNGAWILYKIPASPARSSVPKSCKDKWRRRSPSRGKVPWPPLRAARPSLSARSRLA